jgi:hypothetical protein
VADDINRVIQSALPEYFQNLTPEARERLVNALARHLLEQVSHRQMVDKLRKLK